MSQHLPTGGFEWLGEDEIDAFDLNSISPTNDVGYFLEVDLEYPERLHDSHRDLPFCAENLIPPRSKTKDMKLIPNVMGKSKYVIHYRNLQQALKHGLTLKKIHRALRFDQSPWLKSYIDLNTVMRTKAVNDFEKDFFKLMNNSVFGMYINLYLKCFFFFFSLRYMQSSFIFIRYR